MEVTTVFAKAQQNSASIVGRSFTYSVVSDQVTDENEASTGDRDPQRVRGGLEHITVAQIMIAALYIGIISSLGGFAASRLIKTQSSDAVWATATAIMAALGGVAAVPILRTGSRRRDER
jgi:hypothetical protein